LQVYPLAAELPSMVLKSPFREAADSPQRVKTIFRFCQMVLQNGRFGGNRLLSRKTVEQASLPHLPVADGWFFSESSDFGLGFAVQYDTGTSRPGSPGTLRWGGVFNTTFFIDPKEQLIGISMGQLFPGETEWEQRFQQLVYAAIDD